MDNVIEMTGIYKSFGSVKAIENGKFDLRTGEIHSLMGENGAGKSTLMKILYGIYEPDEGEICIRGNQMHSLTPKQAIEYEIGMVHQEFMLAKELTVLDNIILGFEPKSAYGIDYKKAREKINVYSEEYGLNVDLDKKVSEISVGDAQKVEIIKTLYRGASILILDEPTAVLTPQESLKLFEILNLLKKKNNSIIFISHKLNEIMQISDRITIMRNGKHVATVDKEKTTVSELAKMMIGREVFLNIQKKNCEIGEEIISVKDIFVPGEREGSKLKGVSFDIKRGEIFGIAGVDGNGQRELIEAITGLRTVEKGSIEFKGKQIQNLHPLKIRQAGISHIPEDRNVRGLNRRFSIKENLIANSFYKRPISKWLLFDRKKINQFAQDLIAKYDIRPDNPDASTMNLSGGNAQKVVCAREIDTDFDLLIAAQPTRGVDIGSVETIRELINKVKDQKKSVLLVSADLQEILSLSDRIAVMFEGKITGILPAHEASEENLGLLMAGGNLQ